MAEDFGDKTEAPTQKRKDDARDKGDILKSREFATALVDAQALDRLKAEQAMPNAVAKSMAEAVDWILGDAAKSANGPGSPLSFPDRFGGFHCAL